MKGASAKDMKPIMERHLQTGILLLIVSFVGWQALTTLQLTEASVRQDERVMHLITLTEQLRVDLRNLDNLYLPRREAEVYRNDMRNRIEQLESRISRVEAITDAISSRSEEGP